VKAQALDSHDLYAIRLSLVFTDTLYNHWPTPKHGHGAKG